MKPNTILSWFNGISKLSFKDILKNFIVVVLIILVYVIFNQIEIIKSIPLTELLVFILIVLLFLIIGFFDEKIKSAKKEEDEEELRLIEANEKISPIVDEAMVKCLYRLNASRVMIHCYHNSQKSLGNSPFLKMSVVKELVDEDSNVELVADYFQQQMIGLFRFPTYINTHPYFIGSKNEVKKIDYKYGQNMDMAKDVYVASKVISNKGVNIGFITVGWHNEKQPPNVDIIRNEIEKLAIVSKPYVVVNNN